MKVTYTGNIADPPEGGYRVGHIFILNGRAWIVEKMAHTGKSMVIHTLDEGVFMRITLFTEESFYE